MSTPANDLATYVARYDKAAASDPVLLNDLIADAVSWLENEINWHMGTSVTRTLYYSGGKYTLYLPQPGTVTEVAIRYGSTWTVEDTDDYLVIGTENRELVRASGAIWPGTPVSFLRTPIPEHSIYYSSTTGGHGANNVRVKMTVGYDSYTAWPNDLRGIISRVVLTTFRTPRLRSKAAVDDNSGDDGGFRSALTPMDWRSIKHYKRLGRPEAA